jgi:hypothetical protein
VDLQPRGTAGQGLQEDGEVLPPKHRTLRPSQYLSAHAEPKEGRQNPQPEQQKENDFDDLPEEEVPFQVKLQFVEKLRLITPLSLKIIMELITQICPKAFS